MTHAKVVVVGGGFAGIGLTHQLKRAGIQDVLVLERGSDVGGVWRANTYPGCTCDVPSHLYSFFWAPNPGWTNTFSPQPEIQAYLRHVAERFDVLRHIRFGVAFEEASWDEEAQTWQVSTSEGPITAQILVSAVGPLTEPRLPDVPGIERFQGTVMHSARWDHDYDLTGERVTSVGTGASAIQYVPEIAPTVAQLLVCQRTPRCVGRSHAPRSRQGRTRGPVIWSTETSPQPDPTSCGSRTSPMSRPSPGRSTSRSSSTSSLAASSAGGQPQR